MIPTPNLLSFALRALLGGALPLALLTACDDTEDGASGPQRCSRGQVLVNGACVASPRPGTDASDPGDAPEGDTVTAPDTSAPDAAPDIAPPPDDTAPDTRPPEACVGDAVRCDGNGVPQRCEGGVFVDQAACGPREICLVGRCVQNAGCEPGAVSGCASTTEVRRCDDEGNRFEAVRCDPGPFCLDGVCGLSFCRAGQTRCAADGFRIETCSPAGDAWVETDACDIREGRACSGGECVSGCIAAAKDPSYIGCEYWSVDLPQFPDLSGEGANFPHAVVISNTSDQVATITIDSFEPGVAAPAAVDVPPGQTRAIQFPVNNVAGSTRSLRSFRVNTTEPVVAYQFNPLNNVNIASNDASLLLPVSAIGREYYVMSWTASAIQPAFFTVVGTAEDVTNVTIRFSSDIDDGPNTPAGIRGIRRGDTRTFQIRQGEVLNFENKTRISFPPVEADFTGSHVVADRPVVVFGGHSQAVIAPPGSEQSCCADHLEQQLFPVESWGSRYLAVKAPPRGNEADVWRVMAQRPNTRIVTSPPIPGLDGITLGAGQWAQAFVTQSFEIQATEPILVGQYLLSQQADGITRTIGDPAFILAVPVERFRESYQFLTPDRYREDYVTVIRPIGVGVTLDGTAIPASEFRTFGTNTWEFAHMRVEPGTHYVEAAEPVALMLYGYDTAVSYGVPGGLNLVGSEEP